MPFEKYEPLSKEESCTHREHNPPSHRVYKPGHYVWVCPGCGAKQAFTVQGIRCREERDIDRPWRLKYLAKVKRSYLESMGVTE